MDPLTVVGGDRVINDLQLRRSGIALPLAIAGVFLSAVSVRATNRNIPHFQHHPHLCTIFALLFDGTRLWSTRLSHPEPSHPSSPPN